MNSIDLVNVFSQIHTNTQINTYPHTYTDRGTHTQTNNPICFGTNNKIKDKAYSRTLHYNLKKKKFSCITYKWWDN